MPVQVSLSILFVVIKEKCRFCRVKDEIVHTMNSTNETYAHVTLLKDRALAHHSVSSRLFINSSATWYKINMAMQVREPFFIYQCK